MTLKCFENGADTVIAESVEDAWKVWCETTGEDREDYEDMEWLIKPDDRLITIRYEERVYSDLFDRLPEGGVAKEHEGIEIVTATYGAWANLKGRGWLCSTEW